MLAALVRLYGLLPNDCLDVDRSEGKIVYDLWVIQESNAVITVVSIIRLDGSKMMLSYNQRNLLSERYMSIGTSLNPHNPPLSTTKNRPNHVSGSQISKRTFEFAVELMIP